MRCLFENIRGHTACFTYLEYGGIAKLISKYYHGGMTDRIRLSKKEQKDFFRGIRNASGQTWQELSSTYKLSDRTLRDWARAKYTPSYEVVNNMAKIFNIAVPAGFKRLNRYWHIKKWARKGASARQKKYGLLGNLESRRKGGTISQQRRREDPEKYRKLGCKIKKNINPLQQSPELAELCGILLGDGGLTDTQVRVTLNKKTDRPYGVFVSQLMHKVFGEKPSIKMRESVLNLTLSSLSYVEVLEKIGLRKGNKVKNQVGIPLWILRNKEYSRLCLRGLMDTDGGVYFHNHTINGKRYLHFGLTFTNASLPLILGAKKILESYKLKIFMPRVRNLYIYKFSEVERYFNIIGSSNPKHWKRLKTYQKRRKIP